MNTSANLNTLFLEAKSIEKIRRQLLYPLRSSMLEIEVRNNSAIRS